MATEPYQLKVTCSSCGGTKVTFDGIKTAPCSGCNGSGFGLNGTVDGAEQIADLTNKVNDCLDKLNDILEKLNE